MGRNHELGAEITSSGQKSRARNSRHLVFGILHIIYTMQSPAAGHLLNTRTKTFLIPGYAAHSPSANAREALLLLSSALVPHPRNWHHVLAFAVGERTLLYNCEFAQRPK